MNRNWRTLLTEPSTWRGLVWLLTAAGLAVSPDQQAAIAGAGMAIAGAIGAFFTDTRSGSSSRIPTPSTPWPSMTPPAPS